MHKIGDLMHSLIRRIGRYNSIAVFTTLILLLLLSGITGYLEIQKRSLDDQMQAKRWSQEEEYAQISFFFSKSSGMQPEQVKGVRYQLESRLKEQSIEANNSLARLFVDAYASFGELSLKGEQKSIEVEAIGVGGDFFLFHPVKLLSGQYFAEGDVRNDIILIDEDVAWQLFGSSDIAGKDVRINEHYYKIAGVFEREQKELEMLAGSEGPMVYLPYDAFAKLTGENIISTYEIVMPNPVRGFAKGIIQECFSLEKQDAILVENSDRFSYEAFYQLLKERAVRTMKTNDIVLPFWENIARVKEEKLAEVALFQVCISAILVLYWLGAIIVFMVRHKPTREDFERITECSKDILLGLMEKIKGKTNKEEKK